MTLGATMILSFDCEGRWGMADQPDNPLLPSIDERALTATYERLFALLDELDLPATFAVVGSFLGDRDEFESRRAPFDESREHTSWMAHVDRSLRVDDDGWFLPRLRELLDNRPQHEIASHGYTHLPFDAEGVTDDGRRLELSASIDSSRGKPVTTIVFPRNAVVGTDLLSEFGIRGFRNAANTVHQGRLGRVARVLDEFAGQPSSEDHARNTNPIVIPAGRLLHWRNGVRRVVPVRRTVSYWQGLIKHAISTRGVAHLWLHPHNLITGHQQFELLERALQVASERRRDGLQVMTQADYVRAIEASGQRP